MKIIPKAIPTYIITGFLGVGKTTAIIHLLRHKPETERWAVLVNEFGQIGIDAALIQASQTSDDTEEQGVFVREVAGGCICCSAGVPMTVALNQLLKQAKPDRLFIEPTGLGHPEGIIKALTAPHFQGVIALRSTTALIDARQLSDSSYRAHPLFMQQLQVADQVIANKADLYNRSDLEAFKQLLVELKLDEQPMRTVSQGQLALAWLDNAYPTRADPESRSYGILSALNSAGTASESLLSEPANSREIVRVAMSREGEQLTASWLYSASLIFDHHKLVALINKAPFQRVKGIFVTSLGCHLFNAVSGQLTVAPISDAKSGRLVIIGGEVEAIEGFEQQLGACLLD